MTEHVLVAVRVRPLTPQEQQQQEGPLTIGMDSRHTFFQDPAVPGAVARTFEFDHNFWSLGDPHDPNYAGQNTIFDALGQPLIDHALTGYNACIFAYGQTSSGKTYTMMGPPGDHAALQCNTRAGLIPRMCQTLFRRMEELREADSNTQVLVKMMYYEIYNEKVYCLLNPEAGEHLRVREDRKLGVHIEGITEVPVDHFFQIQELMKLGNKGRHTAQTRMNDRSSRSHAVFCLHLQKREWHRQEGDTSVFQSRVNLVDLAGSERTDKAGTQGSTLREGIHINLSLSHLGVVIRKLADLSDPSIRADSDYVPYRDSLLTRVLQENLGGSSRTVMLATVSPSMYNADETLNTLRYAERVKHIRNTPVVNESSSNQQVLALRRKVREMEAALAAAQTGTSSPLPGVPKGAAWLPPGTFQDRSCVVLRGVGTFWSGTLHAVQPVLVIRSRPRSGDVIAHPFSEGFTIVSDVDYTSPARRLSPTGDDYSPDGSPPPARGWQSHSRESSPSQFPGTALQGGRQKAEFGSFMLSGGPAMLTDEDDPLAFTFPGHGGPPPRRPSAFNVAAARRSSLMAPTLASALKNQTMAPQLERAGELQRTVGHTVVGLADGDDGSGLKGSGSAQRRGRRASLQPSDSKKPRQRKGRSESPPINQRNVARKGSMSLERALQAARERMERQKEQGAASGAMSEDETEETGQFVEAYQQVVSQSNSPVPEEDFMATSMTGMSDSAALDCTARSLESAALGNTWTRTSPGPSDPLGRAGTPPSGTELMRLKGREGSPDIRSECERIWAEGGAGAHAALPASLLGSLPGEGAVSHVRLHRRQSGKEGSVLALFKCQERQVWVLSLGDRIHVDGRPLLAGAPKQLEHGAMVQIADYPPWEFILPCKPGETDTSEPTDPRTGAKLFGGPGSPLTSLMPHSMTIPVNCSALSPGRRSLSAASPTREPDPAMAEAMLELERKLNESRAKADDERRQRERWEKDCAVKEERIARLLGDRESAQAERNDLRRRLADIEAGALLTVTQLQDNAAVTGVRNMVFQCGADGQWRAVGEEGSKRYMLVDADCPAGQREKELASLQAYLRKAEGDLMRSTDESRNALALAEAREQELQKECSTYRQRLKGAEAALVDAQDQAERLLEHERNRAQSRIQELEGEVEDMYARLQKSLREVSDRRRAMVKEAAAKEEEAEQRRLRFEQEHQGKHRQLRVLQEKLDAMKQEQQDLVESNASKLRDILAEIEERRKEHRTAAAEAQQAQQRLEKIQAEEERWQAWAERLRQQRDSVVDAAELAALEEFEVTGFRQDDPLMRKRGIRVGTLAQQLFLRFGAQHLKVYNNSARTGGQPGLRPAPIKELRYDCMRAVRRAEGGLIEIDSQGVRGDIVLQCEDKVKRSLVFKLLQLKTKGCICAPGSGAAVGSSAAPAAAPAGARDSEAAALTPPQRRALSRSPSPRAPVSGRLRSGSPSVSELRRP